MTTTYTFDQIKEDVRKEAEALKVHATSEERERLNILAFNPSHYDNCIYGQITGTCFSLRASFLIFNCCSRYFKSQDSDDKTMEEHAKAGQVLKVVNGESIEGVNNALELREHRDSDSLKVFHFSAIEAYIMTPEANNSIAIYLITYG